jgi:hypothetical protein
MDTKLAHIKPICTPRVGSPDFINICFVWLLTFLETQNIVNLLLSMHLYFALLKKCLIKLSTTSLTLTCSIHCRAMLEIPETFLNLVLEKDRDHLDRSCENLSSVAKSQRVEEYPT